MSPEDQEALHDDLRVLGLPDVEVPVADEPSFDVHEDNWPVVMLFAALGSQWKLAVGMGGAVRTGLDYAGVWAVLNGIYPRKQRAELFAGLQTMEVAALPMLNRKA